MLSWPDSKDSWDLGQARGIALIILIDDNMAVVQIFVATGVFQARRLLVEMASAL